LQAGSIPGPNKFAENSPIGIPIVEKLYSLKVSVEGALGKYLLDLDGQGFYPSKNCGFTLLDRVPFGQSNRVNTGQLLEDSLFSLLYNRLPKAGKLYRRPPKAAT
jgi:hypothetical protein